MERGGMKMRLFKKKPVISEEEVHVQEFLDMVSPSVIRFYSEYFICGNTYRCVWALREYPTATEEQALLRFFSRSF